MFFCYFANPETNQAYESIAYVYIAGKNIGARQN